MKTDLRRLVFIAKKGFNSSALEISDEAKSYFSDYMIRRKLSELGCTFTLESMTAKRAEAFILIHDEINKVPKQTKHGARRR